MRTKWNNLPTWETYTGSVLIAVILAISGVRADEEGPEISQTAAMVSVVLDFHFG